MLKNLKKQLNNWLRAIKLLSIEKWNSWKQKRMAKKRKVLLLDVEAFDAIISTKNEFIVYLQDEIAELKALQKVDTPTRIRVETEFNQARGYKSVHARVREQVLANKKKHEVVHIQDESAYDKVEVE
jgi:hypothetical protein